jgi:hypothetical protein
MTIVKLNSRRSFIWTLGAGASAAVASAAALGGREPVSAADPALQVALLQEEHALRKMHQAFEQAMNKGLNEQVIGLFAVDAEVVFNGGVFQQRNQGVARLYRDRFPSGKSGRWMEPAPGFELAADQQRDNVAVATDRKSAQAVFPYSIQVGMPLESDSSLVAMARLHGEGVRTWWEGGVYKIAYQKDVAGSWRIGRLEYDTLVRADYRPGKRYAQPISVPRMATRFPEDPHGPDALV